MKTTFAMQVKMDIESYIYKKEVDWSFLHHGFTIPVTVQVSFHDAVKNFIPRGQSKDIYLMIEGQIYEAKFINQKFDESKYANHKDLLQVRYYPNSDLAIKLREIFNRTYNFLRQQRENASRRQIFKVPDSDKEYIAIYMTNIQNTFIVDCILKDDIDEVTDSLIDQDEYEFEKISDYKQYDFDAKVELRNKTVKIRKLDRSIGNSLKLLYNFNCQICGNNFGDVYNTNIVETHHLEPFVKSLNNDADNQIVICPNHHSVIHCANPVFDRSKLTFAYPNGYIEKLVLNSHLPSRSV